MFGPPIDNRAEWEAKLGVIKAPVIIQLAEEYLKVCVHVCACVCGMADWLVDDE